MRRVIGRTNIWKPRFTIRGLMLSILGIAIVLTALKPLAGFAEAFYPAFGKLMLDISTPETGIVLCCMVVGLYVVLKLMSIDEK